MSNIFRSNIFKWSLLLFIVLLGACLVYFIYLYFDIQANKTEGFDEAKQIALQNTTLVDVDQIVRFHGDEPYYVLFGKSAEDEELLVFVPFNYEPDDPLIVVNQLEIMSEHTIINSWEQECHQCKFIKITPGILNDEPLWELMYIDSSDRYVLDYVSMYDGSPYEQLRFKTMFQR